VRHDTVDRQAVASGRVARQDVVVEDRRVEGHGGDRRAAELYSGRAERQVDVLGAGEDGEPETVVVRAAGTFFLQQPRAQAQFEGPAGVDDVVLLVVGVMTTATDAVLAQRAAVGREEVDSP
jgi:hypothetical protein